MPDKHLAARYEAQDPPTLGARALMRELEALAATRGLVGARVGYKRNARGEHVVALIFTSFPPL